MNLPELSHVSLADMIVGWVCLRCNFKRHVSTVKGKQNDAKSEEIRNLAIEGYLHDDLWRHVQRSAIEAFLFKAGVVGTFDAICETEVG